MKPMEDDLRRALRRKEPPEGFARRVMERLGEAPARPGVPWVLAARGSWWRAAAAAVCVVVLTVGGALRYEHDRRDRLAAEAARDQLLTALRLTAGKLKMTRARIVSMSYEESPQGARREGGVE